MSRNRYHILWILILAAALRLVQIGAPPVGRHAWRQCDTASVARNFHHNGYRLLYPQIDWEVPGIVEMEFPLYPWVTSLLYRGLGESEAIARGLAILGSLLTIGLLYLLVRRILDERAALWSAFLYAVLPINLFFGRAIMPESWMLAATVAAVYFFLRWTDEDSWFFYCLALFATALACLLKLTALYLGLPLLWLVWQKWGRQTLVRWQFWLFGIVVALVLLLWYGHAYQLGQEFGASFHILTSAGTDKWGTWRLLVDPAFYNQVFVGNLGGRMLTWAGYLIFLVGLFQRREHPLERLFDVWLVAITIMLLLVSGGSYHHDYYSLPMMLPAVVFMSKVFDRGWESRKPLLAAVALLILILSGYRYLGTLAEERRPGADAAIAVALAVETSRDDLVISCNGANPVWLYLSNRRGWGRDCEALDREELLELIQQGARYLVARGTTGASTTNHTPAASYLRTFHEVLRDDKTLFVARLDSPRQLEALSWQTIMLEDFADDAALESWSLHGGTWRVVDGALLGTRVRQTAEARSQATLPACQVCKVGMSLSLVRPPDLAADHDPALEHRGFGRVNAQASIDIWLQDDGTTITLSFSTKTASIGLHQSKDGTRVDSRRVDIPLVEGRSLDVELYSDGFELELLVDRQSVLTTTNRLSSPLAGRLAIRPRLGSIRVDRVEIQIPRVSSHAARPRP